MVNPWKARGFILDLLKGNAGIRKKPYKVNVALTDRCNAQCLTCNIWKKENKDISMEDISRFFEENSFIRWVSLTGGEPFLRDDIADIVRVINEKASPYIINIPTNGINTKDTVDKVKDILKEEIPNIIITVSLNGPKEIHESINNVEGSWKKALSTFEKLREIENATDNLKIFLEFTLSDKNRGCFEQMLDSVSDRDINKDDFVVTFFHTSKHYYGNQGTDREVGDIDGVVEKMSKVPTSSMELVNNIFLKLSSEELLENSLRCEALTSSIFVGSRGGIYPCTINSRKIGDLKNDGYSLKKIVDRTDKQEVLETCQGCWLPCEANQKIMSNFPSAMKDYIKSFFS